MQFNSYLKRKIPYAIIFVLLFSLSSCGSYQYVGVDNDGIYGDTPITVTQNNQGTTVEVPNTSNSDYYQNYFKNKSIEYDNVTENGEIFTDIDSYEGNNYIENDSLIDSNDYIGHAGWGQNSNSVTINYIDNGWNNWGCQRVVRRLGHEQPSGVRRP